MMKKQIILVMVILFASTGVFGCDICGCGVGSYYIGILPEFHKKIAGLRYRYNSLRTHIGAGGLTSYLTTDETYRTNELWGGWMIGKRFRIMGYVPVSFNEKRNQGQTTSKNGLGDVGLQGFYQVFSQSKAMGSRLLVHSLWLGAGVKAPTGHYDVEEKSNAQPNANIFQLGTGSTDFTFNGMYDLRLQDAGINASASYKVNTRNKEQYRYGNKLSLNAQAYYKIRIKQKVTVAPNAGVAYEKAALDKDHGFEVDISGGRILLGTVGAEIAFKQLALGANCQTPFSQNLANGFVKANNRAMFHVAFLF